MNPQDPFTTRGRGRGPWRQGQDHRELRRPRTEEKVGSAANRNSAPADPGAGGDAQRTVSTLSANAKEFYPKGYQPQPVENFYNSQFVEAVSSDGDSSSYENSAQTYQEATNQLIEIMNRLTLNPGKFDDLVTPLVDTFRLWLSDENTILAVINLIVEQSISESNFRYNGARLCSFLNNECGQDHVFRKYLLSRCQQEHYNLNSNAYGRDPRRMCGFALFVAELFIQMEVTKGCGTRIAILGTALIEILLMLLTNWSPENVKSVCQVLKLTGLPLDMQESDKMNEIINTLVILCNNPVVDTSLRNLIGSVIQLRQSGWGEASNFTPHVTSQQYNSCPQSEPVFYGPDGKIMSPEESQFLQESAGRIPDTEDYDDDDGEAWVPDDEMDEEIQAAFEQFLKLGNNQSKGTNASSHKCSD